MARVTAFQAVGRGFESRLPLQPSGKTGSLDRVGSRVRRVGAGVGAAFGVGAIVIERGKHIRLNRNQQLRIRTSYDTQIR